MNGIRNRKDNIHCSAEGYISYIYADRMSSRPRGWLKSKADRIARLRVYKRNGGDMLELARYQKKELPAAAGMEDTICSADEVLRSERRNRKELRMFEKLSVYVIPHPQIKKIVAIKYHIWGL